MKKIIFLFCVVTCLQNYASAQYLIVGTYDSPKSEGIYVYDFDKKAGTAKEVSHVKTSNPSFLAVSKDEQFIYAVNEDAAKKAVGGGVSAFKFDKRNGTLSFLNKQSSKGNHPCHISLSNSGKIAAVCNYSSGNLALLKIKKGGYLDTAHQVIQQYGKSIDTARQKSPHVHSAYFINNDAAILVADLGTDKVIKYGKIKKTGYAEPKDMRLLPIDSGAGPRHIAFNKNERTVYVIEELKSTIAVFVNDEKKGFQKMQTISTLPKDFIGFGGSADIHLSPDGNFLYASNRGESNTIAIFSVNKTNGTLSLIGHQSTLGLAPRNFNFDPSGNFLLVANQKTDEIVIFKIDKNTGLLTDSGNRISIGRPVCVKWISK
jgi:6-phosphogluconolactonase